MSCIELCRTEQRAETQRKMYLTARILNEVVDALTKDSQTEELDPEVRVSYDSAKGLVFEDFLCLSASFCTFSTNLF